MPKKQGKLIWHEVVIQILDVYIFNNDKRPQEFSRDQVTDWHLFKQILKRERTEHYGCSLEEPLLMVTTLSHILLTIYVLSHSASAFYVYT